MANVKKIHAFTYNGGIGEILERDGRLDRHDREWIINAVKQRLNRSHKLMEK